MAFTNGSFNQNTTTNNPSGEKRSFKVGKDIMCEDAKLGVGMYESTKGYPFASVMVTRGIKDPQTGQLVFQQRLPQETPSVLITHENLEAILDMFTDKTRASKDRDFFPNWIDPTNLNVSFDCGYNSKISFVGSATNVKVSVFKEGKGEGTATLGAIPVGDTYNFALWRIMLQKLYYVLVYMNSSKLDREKFGDIIQAQQEQVPAADETDNLDAPF